MNNKLFNQQIEVENATTIELKLNSPPFSIRWVDTFLCFPPQIQTSKP